MPRPTHTPAWAKGMRKLGPGIYIDGQTAHFDANEVCEAMGVPPTPENLETAEKAAVDAFAEAFPNISMQRIEHK